MTPDAIKVTTERIEEEERPPPCTSLPSRALGQAPSSSQPPLQPPQEAEGRYGPETCPQGNPQFQTRQEAPRRGAGTSPSRSPGAALWKNKGEGCDASGGCLAGDSSPGPDKPGPS